MRAQRVVGFATILLVVIAASVSLWHTSQQKRAIVFFSQALRDAGITTQVLVDSVPYTVVRGDVQTTTGKPSSGLTLSALEVAYAKTVAERSPIIGLSGTSPDALDTAIDELARTAAGLAELQTSSSSQHAVQTTLYPIDFLRQSSVLERARLAFIETGSDTDMKHYHAALTATIDRYLRDLSQFRDSFSKEVSTSTPLFYMTGKVIGPKAILEALDTLKTAMQHTKKIAARRMSCIEGHSSHCDTHDLSLPLVPQAHTQPLSTDELQEIPRVQGLFAQVLGDPRAKRSTVVVLSQSVCLDSIGIPPAFTVYPGDAKHTDRLRLGTAADIRFIRTDALPSVNFYSYFKTKGIQYVLASPYLHYACLEFAKDSSAVSAVLAVKEFSTASPMSAYAQGALKQQLLALEKALESQVVYEGDAATYISLSEQLFSSESIPEEVRKDILSTALQFRDQSTNLDRAILSLADTEQGDIVFKQKGIPADLSAANLFFSRSGFMLFFMGQNVSVTSSIEPSFPTPRTPVQHQPYTLYSTMPRSDAINEELIRDIQFFLRAREEL